MRKLSTYNLKNYFFAAIFLLPFVFLYLIIFYMSMDVALDRDNYLHIMSFPFEGREEPLIHIYSYIIGFFISNPVYKLLFLQFISILTLFVVFFKKNHPVNLSGLVKVFLCLVIFFGIFSNMFGVQLRIGYATLIFLFIVFFLNIRPNVYSVPIFLLPCLMHSGLIFAILIYYIFEYFKIKSFKRFVIFLLVSIIASTLMIGFLPIIFEIIGVSYYYYGYLEGGGDFGRKYPFTVLIYMFFLVFILYLFRRKDIKDIQFWYGMSGILLVYMGFVLKFYISFKMLVPISAFMYIYIISKLNFNSLNSYIFIIVSFLLVPFSFLILMLQVGLLK